ncbi:MAG: acyl carrier protein [Planctomycetes bacterium]|nr:acyl carrier protein [Planctomycetota bacterium]
MSDPALLAGLEHALEASPGTMNPNSVLEDLPGWDSLGHLATIAVIDEQTGVTVSADDLRACRTLADLLQLCDGAPTS